MKVFAPCTFQTPNDLVDEWMPKLSGSEVRVLLVIFRKTFGWHKIRDRISVSQLMSLTGLSKNSVIKASLSLAKKGIIKRDTEGQQGREETYYELIIDENSNNSYQCKNKTPPSAKIAPPPVQKLHPQNTSYQNTNNPPLSSPPKVEDSKPPERIAPSAEEEEFLEKESLLKTTDLTPAQRKRVMIFPLKEIQSALEIAKTIPPKKGFINLLMDILKRPDAYEKQNPTEQLTEQQRLALQHNEEIRQAGFTNGVDENADRIRKENISLLFDTHGNVIQVSLKQQVEELKKDIINSRKGLKITKPGRK